METGPLDKRVITFPDTYVEVQSAAVAGKHRVDETMRLLQSTLGDTISIEDVEGWYAYYDKHVTSMTKQLAESSNKYVVIKRKESKLNFSVEFRGPQMFRVHLDPDFGWGNTKSASLHLDLFKNALMVKSKILMQGSRRLKEKYKLMGLTETTKEKVEAEVQRAMVLKGDPHSLQVSATEEYSKGSIHKMAIYTDYMTEGPLSEIEAWLDKKSKMRLMRDICHVIARYHDKGYVHRDLKQSNLFITKINGQLHIVLGDFGLSEKIEDMKAISGTYKYMAPEMLYAFLNRLQGHFSQKVDCYALGVILYELWSSQKIPWGIYTTTDEGVKMILGMMNDIRCNLFSNETPVPLSVEGVISGLLRYDPDFRYSAQQAGDLLDKVLERM